MIAGVIQVVRYRHLQLLEGGSRAAEAVTHVHQQSYSHEFASMGSIGLFSQFSVCQVLDRRIEMVLIRRVLGHLVEQGSIGRSFSSGAWKRNYNQARSLWPRECTWCRTESLLKP